MLLYLNQAVTGEKEAPLKQIREMLRELAVIVDDQAGDDVLGTLPVPTGAVTPAVVERCIEVRKARGKHFPNGWFFDPSWDILLFLYRAHLSGDLVTVGSLSSGTESRPTTTIRWIDIMESYDLISRDRCTFDSRRVYIKLSEKGVDTMNQYFSSISEDPHTNVEKTGTDDGTVICAITPDKAA